MVEEGNVDISKANQEQLMVALYKDLQKSQSQIESLAKANDELKKMTETGQKPDTKLLEELAQLKKVSEESKKKDEEYKKLQETMKQREEDLNKVSQSTSNKDTELKKLSEMIEIQKAKYEETERRLKSFEEERQKDLLFKKKSNLESVVDSYVRLGIVKDTQEGRESKLNDLMSMNETAVSEIRAMIENRLKIEPSPAIANSKELQLENDISNIGNDKEKSKAEKIKELFKIQNR